MMGLSKTDIGIIWRNVKYALVCFFISCPFIILLKLLDPAGFVDITFISLTIPALITLVTGYAFLIKGCWYFAKNEFPLQC